MSFQVQGIQGCVAIPYQISASNLVTYPLFKTNAPIYGYLTVIDRSSSSTVYGDFICFKKLRMYVRSLSKASSSATITKHTIEFNPGKQYKFLMGKVTAVSGNGSVGSLQIYESNTLGLNISSSGTLVFDKTYAQPSNANGTDYLSNYQLYEA